MADSVEYSSSDPVPPYQGTRLFNSEKAASGLDLLIEFAVHNIFKTDSPSVELPFRLPTPQATDPNRDFQKEILSFAQKNVESEQPGDHPPDVISIDHLYILVPPFHQSFPMDEHEILILERNANSFFAEFQAKTNLFARVQSMARFLHDVQSLIQAYVWYTVSIQYIDPEDHELHSFFLRTFCLWQALRFDTPGMKLLDPSYNCDCTHDKNILKFISEGACEHLIKYYPSCGKLSCVMCGSFRPLGERCLGFKSSGKHVEQCSFLRWQVTLTKEHIFSCRNRDKCQFCFILSDLSDTEITRGFNGATTVDDKVLEDLLEEKKNVEAANVVQLVLSDQRLSRQGVSGVHLNHVVSCIRCGCKEFPMCDSFKLIFQYHPLKCTRPHGCKLCSTFAFLHAKHVSRCSIPYCPVCSFLENQKIQMIRRLAAFKELKGGENTAENEEESAGENNEADEDLAHLERLKKIAEEELSRPPRPAMTIKDCTFMYHYKDANLALGCGSPPEALVFFDNINDKEDCYFCKSRHYCNLCQTRLQRRLISIQKVLADWLTYRVGLRLNAIMRWASLESILKKTDPGARAEFENMKTELLPGHKLDNKFMEHLFKLDFEKSIEILQEKLSNDEYFPNSFDNRRRNAASRAPPKPPKKEAEKKKELKLHALKDGKVTFFKSSVCPICKPRNTCDECVPYLRKDLIEAQNSLRNMLREYNALTPEFDKQEIFLTFIDIFRRMKEDDREMISKRISRMIEGQQEEKVPVLFLNRWLNADVLDADYDELRYEWEGALYFNRPQQQPPRIIYRDPQQFRPAVMPPSKPEEQPLAVENTSPVPADNENKTPLSSMVLRIPKRPAPGQLISVRTTVKISDGCEICPPNSYCFKCRTEKFCFLQTGVLMGRDVVKLQTRIRAHPELRRDPDFDLREDKDMQKIINLSRSLSAGPSEQYDVLLANKEALWKYVGDIESNEWGAWIRACQTEVASVMTGRRIQGRLFGEISPDGKYVDEEGNVVQDLMKVYDIEKPNKNKSPFERAVDFSHPYGKWTAEDVSEFGYVHTYEGKTPLVIIPKEGAKFPKKTSHKKPKVSEKSTTEEEPDEKTREVSKESKDSRSSVRMAQGAQKVPGNERRIQSTTAPPQQRASTEAPAEDGSPEEVKVTELDESMAFQMSLPTPLVFVAYIPEEEFAAQGGSLPNDGLPSSTEVTASGVPLEKECRKIPFGADGQYGIVMSRRRDEITVQDIHSRSCTDIECDICVCQDQLDSLNEHRLTCEAFRESCPECCHYGGLQALHIMSCNVKNCPFCASAIRASGKKWYKTVRREFELTVQSGNWVPFCEMTATMNGNIPIVIVSSRQEAERRKDKNDGPVPQTRRLNEKGQPLADGNGSNK